MFKLGVRFAHEHARHETRQGKKGKSLASKWRKFAAKTPFATFMQPLQYDLHFSAAKHKSTALTKKRKNHLETSVTVIPR